MLLDNLVVLALGSNVGKSKIELQKTLEKTVCSLAKGSKISLDRVSSYYFSSPVDYLEQADFCNLCLGLTTSLPISKFHQYIKALEKRISDEVLEEMDYQKQYKTRPQKTIPKGPRVIDIDIIFYRDLVIDNKDLTVPHKSYKERLFVLEPILEIYPRMVDPIENKLVVEYLKKNFSKQTIYREV